MVAYLKMRVVKTELLDVETVLPVSRLCATLTRILCYLPDEESVLSDEENVLPIRRMCYLAISLCYLMRCWAT
jgi:hypothetical protein